MTKHIATATYADTWFGLQAAFLMPQRTTRKGQRTVVYRWITANGTVCDGLAYGHGPNRMIATAIRNPLFTNVVRTGA